MPRNARQILPNARARRRKRLTAVIPAYNESRNIGRVIDEVRQVSSRAFELDLVVVDDGSADQTAERVRESGAQLVSLPFNLGIGLAVQTGFRFALEHGADYVVQVDADGQHVPDEIGKLAAPLESGEADVVVGSRFARGRGEGLESTTFLRWLAGRALAFTIHFLTGKRLSDPTSGFRAFNRRAAELVARDYPDDYPEVQVLVTLARHGFRIVEVPVRMRGRLHGRSSINWWRAVYYVVKVTFASFVDRPRGNSR